MGAGSPPPLPGSYSRQGCGPKSSRFPNPWKASLAPDKTLGSAPKEAPCIKRLPALAGNRNRVLHGALGERPPCKTACRVFCLVSPFKSKESSINSKTKSIRFIWPPIEGFAPSLPQSPWDSPAPSTIPCASIRPAVCLVEERSGKQT